MPLKERLYKNPTSTYLETHLNLNLKIQHYQLVNSVFTAKILGKEKKKKKVSMESQSCQKCYYWTKTS